MTTRFVRAVLQAALLLGPLGLTFAASAQDAAGHCLHLYTDWDLKGDAFAVGPGETAGQLNEVFNDAISSFEAFEGCSCRIYEHFDREGEVIPIDARYFPITVSRIQYNWNDRISSIQCDGRPWR